MDFLKFRSVIWEMQYLKVYVHFPLFKEHTELRPFISILSLIVTTDSGV